MSTKKKVPLAIKVAIITVVGGGLFAILESILPPLLQHNLDKGSVTPASLPVTVTPVSFLKKIEFALTGQPGALNPSLEWDAGSSDLSSYAVEEAVLSLTAGPKTWPNFPMVYDDQPVSGDFSVQVKMVFAPEAAVLTNSAQMAGVLVRPANDRLVQGNASFPPDWGVASKQVSDEGILVGCRGSWATYASDTVFLRMERQADSWRCAYSHNGENWIWLDAEVDATPSQEEELIISLFAYSDTDDSITVRFSDWVIFGNER